MSAIILMTACSEKEMSAVVNKQDIAFSMGTAITTTLYGSNENVLDEELDSVEKTLTDIDRKLSWRIDGSITKHFNDKHIAEVLDHEAVYRTALDIAKASGGAFDPTVFPASQLWHIGEEGQRHPSDAEIQSVLDSIDYTQIRLSDGVLRTDDPNVQIELGAIGKGYAVDQAFGCIDQEKVPAGIISAGSSIRTFGEKPDGSKFRVGLRNPRGGQEDLIGIFTMTDLAISTSGDYEKYFEEDGKRYHHIIDARTGYPADSGLMSVTVIGEDGSLCDALSTAGFILGLDEGMDLMNQYEVLAIFIDNQRNVYYNNEEIFDLLSFDGEKEGYKLIAYNH